MVQGQPLSPEFRAKSLWIVIGEQENMEVVSIIIGLALSTLLGIGLSAAGLHLMLTLIPNKQEQNI